MSFKSFLSYYRDRSSSLLMFRRVICDVRLNTIVLIVRLNIIVIFSKDFMNI